MAHIHEQLLNGDGIFYNWVLSAPSVKLNSFQLPSGKSLRGTIK